VEPGQASAVAAPILAATSSAPAPVSTPPPSAPSSPPPSAAPEASPEAAAPLATSGWISVWSSRWGRVRIDGREVGDSPLVRVVVSAGPHTVGVRAESREQARAVVVTPGQEAKVRFVF